jgi:UDP-N-acetylglucosamine enolpyruvyl transferase
MPHGAVPPAVTLIENAAIEPKSPSLRISVTMGADPGIGTNCPEIDGVDDLHAADINIIPTALKRTFLS